MSLPMRYNSRKNKLENVEKTKKPSKGKLRALRQRTQHLKQTLRKGLNQNE